MEARYGDQVSFLASSLALNILTFDFHGQRCHTSYSKNLTALCPVTKFSPDSCQQPLMLRQCSNIQCWPTIIVFTRLYLRHRQYWRATFSARGQRATTRILSLTTSLVMAISKGSLLSLRTFTSF